MEDVATEETTILSPSTSMSKNIKSMAGIPVRGARSMMSPQSGPISPPAGARSSVRDGSAVQSLKSGMMSPTSTTLRP